MKLAIAPLSSLDTPPAAFIRAASAAGFAQVGLRLKPVTASEVPFPLSPKSREFREVQKALADSGLELLDIEVLSLDSESARHDWLPMLEAGAILGASILNVVGDDPELARFTDTLGALTLDAHEFGIEPVIEPVAFRPMNSFATAIDIALAVGCAVEVDALHFLRTGADLLDLSANPELFPVLQLCDAPTVFRPVAGETHPAGTDAPPAILEARSSRRLPGEGDVPIRQILAAIRPDAAISVEIPNYALQKERSVQEYFALLFDRSQGYLA
jgi:sugar phosphate isomerase/epimerase